MPDNENLKVRRNLTALVEFSRVINSSLDLNFILNNVLLTCLGKFLATKGLVALKLNGKIQLRSSKGLTEENIAHEIERSKQVYDKYVEAVQGVLPAEQAEQYKAHLNRNLESTESMLKRQMFMVKDK